MNSEQFFRINLPYLELDEIANNFFLGTYYGAIQKKWDLCYWSVGNKGACAIQIPPKILVLGDLNAYECSQLAQEVSTLNFPGFFAPSKCAAFFAQSLNHIGLNYEEDMPQRVYFMREQPKISHGIGSGRRATRQDFGIFYSWFHQFSLEAIPGVEPNSKEYMEKIYPFTPVHFWEVDGTPVAMAAINRETKNGANISFVYTPKEYRGKGYASAVTAYLCSEIFQRGKNLCMLSADLRNPVSNKIYLQLGFQPYCDVVSYKKTGK